MVRGRVFQSMTTTASTAETIMTCKNWESEFTDHSGCARWSIRPFTANRRPICWKMEDENYYPPPPLLLCDRVNRYSPHNSPDDFLQNIHVIWFNWNAMRKHTDPWLLPLNHEILRLIENCYSMLSFFLLPIVHTHALTHTSHEPS